MNSCRLEEIFDTAVEMVRGGDDPYLVAMRWPEHAAELYPSLCLSQELFATGPEYDSALPAVKRDVDWERLLSNVPQDEAAFAGSAQLPAVCPAVQQMVVANALSGKAHKTPRVAGAQKRHHHR